MIGAAPASEAIRYNDSQLGITARHLDVTDSM
jgi:hypothetical protein